MAPPRRARWIGFSADLVREILPAAGM